MNNIGKIALTTGLVACAAGALLFGIGMATGGTDYVANRDWNTAAVSGNTERMTREKTRLDDVQSLDVNFKHMDLVIQPSDDDHWYLEYVVTPDKNGDDPITYAGKDGVLTMTEATGGEAQHYVHIDIRFVGELLGGKKSRENTQSATNVVTLYAPKETELESGAIHLNDGDLIVDGVTFQTADVRLGYGDLSLSNSAINGGHVALKDGDAELDNVTSQSTDWELNYGDLLAKTASFAKGSVMLRDGDLAGRNTEWNRLPLTLKCGDLSEKNGAWNNVTVTMQDGDVDSERLTLNGENRVENQCGDVEIALTKESREQTELDLHSADGDVDSYHSSVGTTTVRLTVDCKDGDIEVK